MKSLIIILVLMLAVLVTTPAWSITIGPSIQPDWEPQAQVKVGWIFGDPQNPQNTGVLAGWDRYIGDQPVWDYDPDRIVWDVPGQWYIRIPNLDNDNPVKQLWLSYVYERSPMIPGLQFYTNFEWFPDEGFANFNLSEQWFDANGNPISIPMQAVYGRVLVTVDMYPNPEYEDIWIGLNDGYDLLEVYVITQCIAACDFDRDGNVNFGDIARLALAWMSEPGDAEWDSNCDISDPPDGIIDCGDLAVCVSNWLANI